MIADLLADIEADWDEAQTAEWFHAVFDPAPCVDGVGWVSDCSPGLVDPLIVRAVVSAVAANSFTGELAWFAPESVAERRYVDCWGCRDWPAWPADPFADWMIDPAGRLCVSVFIELEDIPLAVQQAVATVASVAT